MKILILEDDENRIELFKSVIDPRNRIHICRNMYEAEGRWDPYYDIMLLDHDLGERATGYDFVKMYHRGFSNADIVIHAWNCVGARRMQDFLKDQGFKSRIEPFGDNLLKALKGI